MTQEEVLTLVYIVLGSPSTDLLSNDIVNYYIDQWEVMFPLDTNSCEATYNVVVSCVNYIISKLTNDNLSNSAGSSRSESEGKRSISVKTGSTTPIDAWKDWLSNFLANPIDYLPCLADVEGVTSGAMPLVTGLQRDKYIDVLGDPNNISNGLRIHGVWDRWNNKRLDSFVDGYWTSTRRRRY